MRAVSFISCFEWVHTFAVNATCDTKSTHAFHHRTISALFRSRTYTYIRPTQSQKRMDDLHTGSQCSFHSAYEVTHVWTSKQSNLMRTSSIPSQRMPPERSCECCAREMYAKIYKLWTELWTHNPTVASAAQPGIQLSFSTKFYFFIKYRRCLWEIIIPFYADFIFVSIQTGNRKSNCARMRVHSNEWGLRSKHECQSICIFIDIFC